MCPVAERFSAAAEGTWDMPTFARILGMTAVGFAQRWATRTMRPARRDVSAAWLEQEVRAAFADHDRRCVGVGARNARQRRGIGDTKVVNAADAKLLVERAVRFSPRRHRAGRVIRR